MTVDREYCMSSFLTYRVIADPERCFAEGLPPRKFPFPQKRLPVKDSSTLKSELERATRDACKDGKAALALSGGIAQLGVLELLCFGVFWLAVVLLIPFFRRS